jgi:hypothetical protein
MSQLLGLSVKAIYSYEQGWRSIPAHVERQVFFLLSRKKRRQELPKSCWVVKNAPPNDAKNVRPMNIRQADSVG